MPTVLPPCHRTHVCKAQDETISILCTADAVERTASRQCYWPCCICTRQLATRKASRAIAHTQYGVAAALATPFILTPTRLMYSGDIVCSKAACCCCFYYVLQNSHALLQDVGDDDGNVVFRHVGELFVATGALHLVTERSVYLLQRLPSCILHHLPARLSCHAITAINNQNLRTTASCRLCNPRQRRGWWGQRQMWLARVRGGTLSQSPPYINQARRCVVCATL